jgi:hypothetical protein
MVSKQSSELFANYLLRIFSSMTLEIPWPGIL